jgi:hypothetical protein
MAAMSLSSFQNGRFAERAEANSCTPIKETVILRGTQIEGEQCCGTL